MVSRARRAAKWLGACGLAGAGACYADGVRKPELHYCKGGAASGASATTHAAALVDACPLLRRTMWPTPWAFNREWQLVLYELDKKLAKRAPRATFRRQLLEMRDGGVTALDWVLDASPGLGRRRPGSAGGPAGPDEAGGAALPALAEDAPVCVFFHTITATQDDQYGQPDFFLAARRRGMRPVVHVRRGHGGLPLRTRRFSTMGDMADVAPALAAVHAAFPAAPVVLVGCSAGSAPVVRYLGDAGAAARARHGVVGGVAICPGFKIPEAWALTEDPWSGVILGKVKAFFVERHAPTWAAGGAAVQARAARALAAETLPEFQEQASLLAGWPSYAAYNAESDPMAPQDAIATPLLVIVAENDPLCVVANARSAHAERLFATNEQAVMAVTRTGSHLSFLHGWRGCNWAHDATFEWLAACCSQQPGGGCGATKKVPVPDHKAGEGEREERGP